jgi:hemoglobin-like flavoprotein
MEFLKNDITEQQVKLVYESWQILISDSVNVSKTFYKRLFEIAPELKLMFRADSVIQEEKFTATITSILTKAYAKRLFVNDVEPVAYRHVMYGVVPEHFPIVGEALIFALKDGLRQRWNDNLQEAWSSIYRSLSEMMIKSIRFRDNSNVA